MSNIKLKQIDQKQLRSFVDSRIAKTTLAELKGVAFSTLRRGDLLTLCGSPPSWLNVPEDNIDLISGEGIIVTVGSPDTTVVSVDSMVALRNTKNEFTLPLSGISNAGVVLKSGAPGMIFYETDADANEKVWRFFVQDGQLFFDLRNDTNSNSLNWLEVKREGLSINNVNFTTKSFTINDNKVLTSADISNLVTRIEQLEKRIEELS